MTNEELIAKKNVLIQVVQNYIPKVENTLNVFERVLFNVNNVLYANQEQFPPKSYIDEYADVDFETANELFGRMKHQAKLASTMLHALFDTDNLTEFREHINTIRYDIYILKEDMEYCCHVRPLINSYIGKEKVYLQELENLVNIRLKKFDEKVVYKTDYQGYEPIQTDESFANIVDNAEQCAELTNDLNIIYKKIKELGIC